MHKIKVMVVDDSAVVRQVISGALARDRSIEVLAAVADPIFAMQACVPLARRDRARRGNAAHGRHHLPQEIMTERPTPVSSAPR